MDYKTRLNLLYNITMLHVLSSSFYFDKNDYLRIFKLFQIKFAIQDLSWTIICMSVRMNFAELVECHVMNTLNNISLMRISVK